MNWTESMSIASQGKKILILHKGLADYRLPLFSLLQKNFGSRLEFWIFGIPNFKRQIHSVKTFSSFIPLPILKFSWGILPALFRIGTYDQVVLMGAHSLEIFFVFFAARLRGIPIIFFTETWDYPSRSPRILFYQLLFGFIALRSDFCLYPGREVRDFYLRLGISSNHLLFAPNSVHPKLCPAAASLEGISSERKKILILARLIPLKNIALGIRAVELLKDPNVSLAIAYSKKNLIYAAYCRFLARRVPSISFIAIKTSEEKCTLFSSADLFLLPSRHFLGRRDVWGFVLNEFLPFDKPLIATGKVGAAGDLIINGKNGYATEDLSPRALARLIKRAFALPLNEVRKTNQFLLKKYSPERQFSAFKYALTSNND